MKKLKISFPKDSKPGHLTASQRGSQLSRMAVPRCNDWVPCTRVVAMVIVGKLINGQNLVANILLRVSQRKRMSRIHVCFIIRNLLAQLWSLAGSVTYSQQVRDPG